MAFLLWRRVLSLGMLFLLALPLRAAGEFPLPAFLPEVTAYPAGEVAALQPLAALLGCTATRDELSGEVTVARQGCTFVFSPLGLSARDNGQAVRLPFAPMMRNATCYVPLRALITALHGTVQPGVHAGTLAITLPGLAAPVGACRSARRRGMRRRWTRRISSCT